MVCQLFLTSPESIFFSIWCIFWFQNRPQYTTCNLGRASTRHFLSCYSCSYYISMMKGNLLINPSFMENLPDLKLLIERFERDIQESCKCSLRRIADTKRLSHVTLKIRWLEILDNLDASLWIQFRKLWSQYW